MTIDALARISVVEPRCTLRVIGVQFVATQSRLCCAAMRAACCLQQRKAAPVR